MLKKISTLLLSAIVLVCSLSANISAATFTQEHTPSTLSNEIGTGGGGGNGTFTFHANGVVEYQHASNCNQPSTLHKNIYLPSSFVRDISNLYALGGVTTSAVAKLLNVTASAPIVTAIVATSGIYLGTIKLKDKGNGVTLVYNSIYATLPYSIVSGCQYYTHG